MTTFLKSILFGGAPLMLTMALVAGCEVEEPIGEVETPTGEVEVNEERDLGEEGPGELDVDVE